MTDDKLIELVRENERLKQALKSCRSFAEQATFGGWRHQISALCDSVLGGR